MKAVFAFAIEFTFFTFFFQYSDTNSYSVIDEEAETNLSYEACLIYASVVHSVIHNNNFCISSTHD